MIKPIDIIKSTLSFLIFTASLSCYSQDYQLVWSDEFEGKGNLDSSTWNFENGFVRNHEGQWYQDKNAFLEKGKLIIEARKEDFKNPNFETNSQDWKNNRKTIEYTSASVNTRGKKEFLYGRVEVKAKIPTASGSWPAIWTLGNSMPWPSCGEIDIMEYYPVNNVPHILANAAWGSQKPNVAVWNSKKINFQHFLDKDKNWKDKFHIWRMDWDENSIAIFLDDELINKIDTNQTINQLSGFEQNPFQQPHYLLLNLALGGDNGGAIDDKAFPVRYEIDYVRVYQKKSNNLK